MCCYARDVSIRALLHIAIFVRAYQKAQKDVSHAGLTDHRRFWLDLRVCPLM